MTLEKMVQLVAQVKAIAVRHLTIDPSATTVAMAVTRRSLTTNRRFPMPPNRSGHRSATPLDILLALQAQEVHMCLRYPTALARLEMLFSTILKAKGPMMNVLRSSDLSDPDGPALIVELAQGALGALTSQRTKSDAEGAARSPSTLPLER